jgi:hypothetical protein
MERPSLHVRVMVLLVKQQLMAKSRQRSFVRGHRAVVGQNLAAAIPPLPITASWGTNELSVDDTQTAQ